jgi:hypothetical protein
MKWLVLCTPGPSGQDDSLSAEGTAQVELLAAAIQQKCTGSGCVLGDDRGMVDGNVAALLGSLLDAPDCICGVGQRGSQLIGEQAGWYDFLVVVTLPSDAAMLAKNVAMTIGWNLDIGQLEPGNGVVIDLEEETCTPIP